MPHFASNWLSCCAAVLLLLTLSTQATKPQFEVASIKRLDARSLRAAPPSRLQTPTIFYRESTTVASLIGFAYGITTDRISGGPDWVRRDQFEVHARAADEVSEQDLRLMMQSLLESRFALAVRRHRQETRHSVLILARADGRLGPNLRKCDDPESERPVPLPLGGVPYVVLCRSLSAVADLASGHLQMPVLDETGVTGLWSYHLVFALPQARMRVGPLGTGDAPSFNVALEEQLGLKLESRHGPIDMLLVESVEPPTEN